MNYLTLSLALLASFQLAACATKIVIDSRGSLDSSFADHLCSHGADRFGRLSTIDQVLQQVEASHDTHCRKEWLQPLRRLKGILEASSRDACSLETVELIEKFHWDYIVAHLSKAWRKAVRGPISDTLKVFFLHFADQTAERCRVTLSQRLKQAVRSTTQVDTNNLFMETKFGTQLDALSMALVPKKKVQKYENFFLILSSIVAMQRKKGNHVIQEVDRETGELIYVSFKLQDPTNPRSLQQKCRQELRPIYANTVLPVLRLIDMGYGNKNDKITDELVKEWYAATQLCQLVLPIKFYTGAGVKSGQVTIVSEEEAKRLDISHGPVPQLPQNVQVSPVRMGDQLNINAGDDRIVQKVKSYMKARGSVYRKTLRSALSKMRSSVTSRIKNIFSTKKSKENSNQVLLMQGSLSDASLNKAEHELDLDEREDDEHGLVRRKRDYYNETHQVKMGTTGEKLAIVLLIICVILLLMICGHVYG